MGLLPPRRHWPRLLRRDRVSAVDLPGAKAKRLEVFVLKHLREQSQHAWVARLRAFLDESKARILGWDAGETIVPVRSIAIPKTRPGNKMKYRVLAPYALRDAIADSVFASYLRNVIDGRLDPDCYAFRLAIGPVPITHHDAVANLRRFASEGRGSRIWVAECDIRGFFDSVSHDVTKKAVAELLTEVDGPVDRRLLSFVESFFAGYDYLGARREALGHLARQKVQEPDIYDPHKALAQAGIPADPRQRIGIPQGSAFSSVLANVVLTKADRGLRTAVRAHKRTFYARYVDDIFLASSNRRVTSRGISAYRRALRALELPDHPPQVIGACGSPGLRAYWDAKSKAPYAWSARNQSGVEWIGFLGYQMRRDGTLRVRRSSVKKELAKQRRAIDDIIGIVDKNRMRSHRDGRMHVIPKLRQIRYAAMMHLISIGIGYPAQPLIWPAPNGICWASGFRLLRDERRDLCLLKTLDRGRSAALAALQARLGSLAALPGIQESKSKRSAASFAIRRDGRPLSYYAYFVNNPRMR